MPPVVAIRNRSKQLWSNKAREAAVPATRHVARAGLGLRWNGCVCSSADAELSPLACHSLFCVPVSVHIIIAAIRNVTAISHLPVGMSV
jgi:hypothetical protein